MLAFHFQHGPYNETRYYDARAMMKDARTAPLYKGEGRQVYDSIISNPKYVDPDKQGHREFVVYDRNLTYPEFIVKVTCSICMQTRCPCRCTLVYAQHDKPKPIHFLFILLRGPLV